MSKAVLSAKELTALCREWQERLRLQDWRVRVRRSEKHELPTGKEAGNSFYLSTKQAVITINPFAQHAHGDPDPLEVCLIHELLHLHLEGAFDDELTGAYHKNFEAGIDCIAWALYRAKYGDKVKDVFLEA